MENPQQLITLYESLAPDDSSEAQSQIRKEFYSQLMGASDELLGDFAGALGSKHGIRQERILERLIWIKGFIQKIEDAIPKIAEAAADAICERLETMWSA